MKMASRTLGLILALSVAGCVSSGIFDRPTNIAADSFEALLRSETTIKEVEKVLGDPRLSGGTVDVTPDGLAIDLPRFDYVLALQREKKKPEVIFVSFWFRESQLDFVSVRDPKSLRNVKQLFPALDPREPNQPPQRNAGSRPSSGDSSVSDTSSSRGPRG